MIHPLTASRPNSISDMWTGQFLRRILSTLFTLLCFLSLAISVSHELQTLLTIKTSLKNSSTFVFDSWDIAKNPTCNFTGITCDPTTNLVKEIELSNQNLSGEVPFNAICQLKSLEKLSLGFNFLSGQVTEGLNNCVNLRYLDLGNNNFVGSIPDISFLSQLMYFYVNSSGFSGTFPWNSLDNVTNLVEFSIGDNLFNRTPFPIGVVKNTKLNVLHMSNCSIEGKIPPGIGNLTELRNLELSRNSIFGEIPVEICRLSKLWQLKLSRNQLTGKFPVGFGNLTNLQLLDASINYLTGDISEIRHLTKLISLRLSMNELTGELPAELGEFKQLVSVSIFGNKLTGIIPQNLGSWSEFDFIDASENFLTGPIPPEMCKKGTMRRLLLLQNNLSGEIPENYANCLTLIRLRVSENLLSGVVPKGIWGLPNIDMIDIAMNKLVGPVTSDIKNAKSLTKLLIKDNQFSSELPSEISKATNLGAIDLSGNLFSGGIPSTIGELKQLNHLYLQINKFSGPIPDSLGSCHSLSHINLAYNSLTGDIPMSLGYLPSLTFLNLSNNQISGQIPGSLSSLKLGLLDLSYNRLSGPIPKSLSIDVYNGSFAGNDGLCGQNLKNFPPCSSHSRGLLALLLICFLALVIIAMLVSVAYFFYPGKKGLKDNNNMSWKEDSWDVKSFHILNFTEDDILDGINRDNLIGNGGSGNVYKISLENGTDLAVKHIWSSDSGSKKLVGSSTTPMLSKRRVKSSELDAEVRTLSSIRHVNVVKLYCSVTKPEFGENKDMVSWVSCKLKNKETALSIVDSAILEGYKEEALKVLKIAILCTAGPPMQRPTMRIVVQMLEDAIPCK
ncbi:hypothetical protein ACH5RR_034849 [Cinchona calisaya]|uniref:Protein kinase domain-containing protein n=1 Tax=Cinchona calisaya TaxID=153742 RepID=A0ABD2YHH8_9GENT